MVTLLMSAFITVAKFSLWTLEHSGELAHASNLGKGFGKGVHQLCCSSREESPLMNKRTASSNRTSLSLCPCFS